MMLLHLCQLFNSTCRFCWWLHYSNYSINGDHIRRDRSKTFVFLPLFSINWTTMRNTSVLNRHTANSYQYFWIVLMSLINPGLNSKIKPSCSKSGICIWSMKGVLPRHQVPQVHQVPNVSRSGPWVKTPAIADPRFSLRISISDRQHWTDWTLRRQRRTMTSRW